MTAIRLTNTKTRREEAFEPIDREDVRMYVCGPTVYDRAHLGNARPVVVFDVLFRLLRHVYGARHVTYVRNVTDVDDKINARAAETGRPIRAITDETIAWFHEDMDALGALRPSHEPRATSYVDQMKAMIGELIAGGHAYEVRPEGDGAGEGNGAGHVLFRVRSYEGYGRLSGRSVDDMMAGARVEVAPFKEDPLDFVLWKPSTEAQPGWDSPWGRGRPGWHIECSAMARELLGTHFDIHGGGLDLQFPHHENEWAQSACADPGAGFANVWMHNEMLLVDGRKMSKSLGNFVTVRDLLDQGVPGEVIRFVLLGTHYGKPMDWTADRAAAARRTLKDWYAHLGAHEVTPEAIDLLKEDGLWAPDAEVLAALSDDLNTHLAITRLHRLAAGRSREEVAAFAASVDLLGLVSDWSVLPDVAEAGAGRGGVPDPDAARKVEALLGRRAEARARRDFGAADRIRDALVAAGVVVTDGLGGGWSPGPDFDPSGLGDVE